jgi:hypothetical protein
MFRTLALTLLLAAPAFAQEYGRTAGGQLDLLTKQPAQFSGSFGLSRSSLFGSKGYEGTFGGTVLRDKMWFFASGLKTDAPTVNRITFVTPRYAEPTLSYAPAPSWFGNVKSTNIVSPNSFFTVNVSQSVVP